MAPYEEERTITWTGRNLPADEIGHIHIYRTEHPIHFTKYHEYEAISDLPEVTNDWITRPPGSRSSVEAAPAAAGAEPDARRVMVVHGRQGRGVGEA